MVLEGAAKAAAARLAPVEPDAQAEPDAPGAPAGSAEPDTGLGPVRPGEVRVVQAPGLGDDAIVAVVRQLPGRRVVVTADRGAARGAWRQARRSAARAGYSACCAPEPNPPPPP